MSETVPEPNPASVAAASTESTAQLNVLNPKKKKRATLIAVAGDVQSNLGPTHPPTITTILPTEDINSSATKKQKIGPTAQGLFLHTF
jgi:hypothetical protein